MKNRKLITTTGQLSLFENEEEKAVKYASDKPYPFMRIWTDKGNSYRINEKKFLDLFYCSHKIKIGNNIIISDLHEKN